MTNDLTAIRAQMEALTGWTGKPHVSAMEFGPNVAAKARKIIGQLCDALDAERAENELLRTALTKINVGDGWAAQIARAALAAMEASHDRA